MIVVFKLYTTKYGISVIRVVTEFFRKVIRLEDVVFFLAEFLFKAEWFNLAKSPRRKVFLPQIKRIKKDFKIRWKFLPHILQIKRINLSKFNSVQLQLDEKLIKTKRL